MTGFPLARRTSRWIRGPSSRSEGFCSKLLRRVGPAAAALSLALCPLSVAQNPSGAPEQVVVSVKIIEFRLSKDVDTGLSAFFAKTAKELTFGRMRTSGNALTSADLTFPTSTAGGITVFLDRIFLNEGNIEIVLQALVDEDRAFILSRPRALVIVGEKTPTKVETTQQIPYETTVVVGSTVVQVTAFEDTGVSLELTVPEIIDDDGDWNTRHDTFIRMDVKASVKEEGQRIVVALDDQQPSGTNALTVPEFISRSITTHVWVRDGQVLMFGGLLRNSDTKSISTIPGLTKIEDIALRPLERVLPGNLLTARFSSIFGSRSKSKSRRELVFMIKAEIWRPSFGMISDLGFEDRPGAVVGAPPGLIEGPLEDPSERRKERRIRKKKGQEREGDSK